MKLWFESDLGALLQPMVPLCHSRLHPDNVQQRSASLSAGTRTGGTELSNNWSWQRYEESAYYLGIFHSRWSRLRIKLIRPSSELSVGLSHNQLQLRNGILVEYPDQFDSHCHHWVKSRWLFRCYQDDKMSSKIHSVAIESCWKIF